MSPARYRAGLTLLELIAAIAIILILMGLLVGVITRLPGAADRVKCTENLHGIYLGLSSYVQEKGHWPQQPPFTNSQQTEYGDWWVNELKPYGVPEKMWQCPGILRLGSITKEKKPRKVHYSPTMFDNKPGTARKWPNMPWVVEIGNAHGHGPLLILPDGSVHDYDTYLAQFAK